jgi:soluble lytic murein transglycosylase
MRLFIYLILFSAISPLPAVATNDDPAQRERFRQTHAHLIAGDMARYAESVKGLESYPLYYYLRYVYLRNNFAQVTNAQIHEFLSQYSDTPLAGMLQSAWLRYLSDKKDWGAYVTAYTPQDNVAAQCLYAFARLQSKQETEQAWEDTRALWTVGHSQADECNPLFDLWYKSSHLTPADIQKRIDLALAEGNVGLATFLSRRLDDPAEKARVAQWQRAHDQPPAILEKTTLRDNEDNRALLLYALQRIVRKDAAQARRLWLELKNRYTFTDVARAETERSIALAAHRQGLSEAQAWLAALDMRFRDDSVVEVQIRYALEQQNWTALRQFIFNLSPQLSQTHQWRYWLARASEALGDREFADKLYRELATVRDYYGFLAADRSGQPYAIVDKPISSDAETRQALLAKSRPLLRAREFYKLSMIVPARREWVYGVDQLSPADMLVAADMARDWGWFERAIATVAKAGAYDDLNLRFPLLYRNEISAAAQEQLIDDAWLYGIVRQESAFSEDVRSSAGALGLTQVLPTTAELMAAKLNLPITAKDESSILAVDNNVRLGSAYLRDMLNRFGGNYMLATAAYNAGPGRVQRWRQNYDCLPADLWVELIPFRETRNYVRRVMEYTIIFEARLGLEPGCMRLRDARSSACDDSQTIAWQCLTARP